MSESNGSYTTSRGVVVHFNGIATLIDALQASLNSKKPQPPSYEVKTAVGVIEKHAHDETTLETDEEKKAWAEYQANLQAWNAESQTALMRIVLLRGITLELPTTDEWEKQQAFFGIDVPQDPMEKRLHYLQTEVLGSVNDYGALVAGTMRASGVPEDLLTQMESSFRRSVVRSTVKPARAKTGKVEREPAL